MPGKPSKKATPRKKVGKSDQILALLTSLDNKVNGLERRLDGLDRRSIRFETETMQRFDAIELKIIGFKDEILSVVDVTRKEYDETRQERIATGAAQDRQQEEIEALKISDGKQNQALKALETRVTDLEMNKAA